MLCIGDRGQEIGTTAHAGSGTTEQMKEVTFEFADGDGSAAESKQPETPQSARRASALDVAFLSGPAIFALVAFVVFHGNVSALFAFVV